MGTRLLEINAHCRIIGGVGMPLEAEGSEDFAHGWPRARWQGCDGRRIRANRYACASANILTQTPRGRGARVEPASMSCCAGAAVGARHCGSAGRLIAIQEHQKLVATRILATLVATEIEGDAAPTASWESGMRAPVAHC